MKLSSVWLIIRSLKCDNETDGYIVKPNDIIKIGRVILRVAELNTENHRGDENVDEEFDDIITLKDEPENEDA